MLLWEQNLQVPHYDGLGPGEGGRFESHTYNGNKVAHSAWTEINWADYNTAFGETRPACGDIDSDKKDEILVGLGKGGEAIMQIFDDGLQGCTYLASLQIGPQGYDAANGETWPAGIMLNQFSRVNPMPWLKILLLGN